jgi:hypothetical protein
LQAISPANSYPRHDVSCICLSSCRVSKWIDRSFAVTYTIYSLIAPSFTIAVLLVVLYVHLRRGFHRFSPLCPLMHRVIRLFGSRPWIDALFLLVMAISWLGKVGFVCVRLYCALIPSLESLGSMDKVGRLIPAFDVRYQMNEG